MKDIDNYIQEKLRINQDTKVLNRYNYHPKDVYELRTIIEKRINKDKNANLNDIDVNKIKDFVYINDSGGYGLFYKLDIGNIKINDWDMSNAIDTSYMFYDCEDFNCDLSKWDMSNVNDASFMFKGCSTFEGKGLENWNVSQLEYFRGMFDDCDSFKNKPNWYKN